jgi:hypothetical protein
MDADRGKWADAGLETVSFEPSRKTKPLVPVRIGYEAFNALLDWLNTLFTVLPSVGRIVIAASARNTSKRAYSTRSCPFSSRINLRIVLIIVLFPLLMAAYTSSPFSYILLARFSTAYTDLRRWQDIPAKRKRNRPISEWSELRTRRLG